MRIPAQRTRVVTTENTELTELTELTEFLSAQYVPQFGRDRRQWESLADFLRYPQSRLSQSIKIQREGK